MRTLALATACLLLSSCTSSLPPLSGMREPLDLQRFMGDWYVLAFIPIDLPFISEKDAHNGVESYRLAADGTIETTYTFRDGAFDGPPKRMTPRARVANPPVNTEWKMKFFWFLPAGDYLIVDRDEAYTRTIIAVPDRRWVWLMARTPSIAETDYEAMIAFLEQNGFDIDKLRKVPQHIDLKTEQPDPESP
ncbi:MAG TPA: lipocalin family protein [Gammaproteobacteria bacterium]|nr:lipocalin family protein [Gammaproteobacteria bacterium]